MNEMVQKVGGAILLADMEWAPKSPQSREETLARAAIEAMREPTEAMIAEVSGGAHFRGGLAASMHRSSWQAMIDAALSQKGE